MKRLIIAVLLAAILILMPSASVSAHRSGCHRWHSCPSDSGSYTCGDTGYDNYCGTQETYSAPDYSGQGTTNGRSHAVRESTTIESTAKALAQTNAQNDVQASRTSTPTTDTTPACDKQFTYDTPQPAAYTTAYHDAYKASCDITYASAYRTAYVAAYQQAEVQKAATVAEVDAENTSSTDYSWLWWVVIIGGFIVWGWLSDSRSRS